jgi:hypothetical protein
LALWPELLTETHPKKGLTLTEFLKVLLGIKKYDYFYCLFGPNFKQRQMQKRSMTLVTLNVDLVVKIVRYIYIHKYLALVSKSNNYNTDSKIKTDT